MKVKEELSVEPTTPTTIYLVKEFLNEHGALAVQAIAFSTIEKARKYIAHCREYFIDYCNQHHYQFSQKLEYQDDYSYRCDDYTNDQDSVYIIQTNRKRNPFSYTADIEETILN